MLLETIILLLATVLLLRYYINQQWQFFRKLGVPHDPPTIRGLGNMAKLMKDKDNIFKCDLENKKKFGYIYGFYNGLKPQISISDPNILKKIFIKEFDTFPCRQKAFTKVQGKEMNTGLNLVEGRQWKRIRNTLSPSFSSSKLKEMMSVVENCVDKTVEKLIDCVKVDDGRFQAKELFTSLSLDVICATAFSTNVYGEDEKHSAKLKEMATKMFDITVYGSPAFMLFYMFPWTETIAGKLNFSLFPKEVVNYFSVLVDTVIQRRENSTEPSRTDLLQLMLQAKVPEGSINIDSTHGMTRTEVVGNSLLMMLAGFETTGNSMMFLAYNLANYQTAQEQLHEEIEKTWKEYGAFTYEAVNDMKFFNQCINESLRLYGLLPRNARHAERDITIDGLHIPKGLMINIPVYGLNHDEEYWDEPFVFKPERMEDMSKIDPMVFQPFGAGPRNCIGMRLALLEIKITFCKILQNFSLQTCNDTPKPPLEMTFQGAMRPKELFYLQAVERK